MWVGMRLGHSQSVLFALLFAGCLLPVCAADPLPAASNVLHRLVQRAQEVARHDESKRYTYEKLSITEELNAEGEALKKTEKLYHVVLVGGLPFQRVVKIQGRDLTPAELEKENQREAAFRQKLSGVDMKKKSTHKEGLVTQDLLDRFEFRVLKREIVAGRNTLLLAFKAKRGNPEKSLQDKLLNRFSGKLWVDEQEHEVVKLDSSMLGPVHIGWLGAVGALQQCDLALERERLHDGVWVNSRSTFMIFGRKLFQPLRYKTIEESKNFQRG
jgi:hypothetical protein